MSTREVAGLKRWIGVRHEPFVATIVLIVLWETLSRLSPWLSIPNFAIPSIGTIGHGLLKISLVDVAATMARVLAALLLSFVTGAALAVAMFTLDPIERYVRPVIRLLMAVPVVSWVLFAILWFKGVEFRIVFVLIVVCAPVFVVDLYDGMKEVSRDLRRMMWSFRPNMAQYFFKLIFPPILPGIFTCWKITLSLAIRVVTIAELVGATTGIGHQLAVAQELFSVADVFAWTLVLVTLLYGLESLIVVVEGRVLRWRA